MRRRPGAPMTVIATPATFAASQVTPAAVPALADFLDGMLNDGGIRVSHTTASNRRYTGADLTPQLFLLPPALINDNLTTAAQTAGVSRNQLNRRRGAGAP